MSELDELNNYIEQLKADRDRLAGELEVAKTSYEILKVNDAGLYNQLAAKEQELEALRGKREPSTPPMAVVTSGRQGGKMAEMLAIVAKISPEKITVIEADNRIAELKQELAAEKAKNGYCAGIGESLCVKYQKDRIAELEKELAEARDKATRYGMALRNILSQQKLNASVMNPNWGNVCTVMSQMATNALYPPLPAPATQDDPHDHIGEANEMIQKGGER
jgi:hypothetical protein